MRFFYVNFFFLPSVFYWNHKILFQTLGKGFGELPPSLKSVFTQTSNIFGKVFCQKKLRLILCLQNGTDKKKNLSLPDKIYWNLSDVSLAVSWLLGEIVANG